MSDNMKTLLYRIQHYGGMAVFDEFGSYEENIDYLTEGLSDDDWQVLIEAEKDYLAKAGATA